MGAILDLAGRRFGRLVAVSIAKRKGVRAWECRCDCGRARIVRTENLTAGHTRSCGCLRDESRMSSSRTHGHETGRRKSPTLSAWRSMTTRCTNPNDKSYARYGGRGIAVCERWRSFENFLADMGERPPGTSIDRIDNLKGYEPGNCRWATLREQANNQRSNIRITIGRVTRTAAEWAREFGIYERTAHSRIRRGWAPVDAVSVRALRPNETARGLKGLRVEARVKHERRKLNNAAAEDRRINYRDRFADEHDRAERRLERGEG